MSFNGSGVFNINTAGQPVVTGTTISSTTFNNLTADLATGLTTTLTKDGQSTPTANIGLGTYKIVNLGAGTVASDAARLDQVQGGAATFITVTGTDTLTGTVSPALSAYATGNQFSFLVANTNTGAVTINVDGIGSKAITRTGTTALVAGDMVAGQAVEIIYDGTRFQLVNGNSFTNLKVSGTLGVTGVATFTAQPIVSSLTASLPVFTDASKGLVSNTMTGTGNVVMSTSPTLVTPALGTPSALVGTNITGTATNFTASNVTTNANLTGMVTSVGNAASLGSFTSAQLGAALTDETGTGVNVFATSPTLVTPLLGTPTSGVLTNCTGLPVAGGGTGVATTTAYGVLAGGTTSTGAFQNIGTGTSAQVLTSNGAGALPTFQAASSSGVTTIGFGTTGLTPSGATGGVVTVAGTLAVANGGTGVTTKTGTGANVLGTSPTLTTPTFDSASLATISGTAPLYMCRAWVNFNGTGSGTFAGGASTVTRIAASTTATITTTTAHELITGNSVWALTGVVAGAYTVTVLTTTTFTITTVATTALSAVSITFAVNSIRASGNVSSITDNGVGMYTVNFETAMPDANYSTNCSAGFTSATGFIRTPSIGGTYTSSAVAIDLVNVANSATIDLAIVSVSVFR